MVRNYKRKTNQANWDEETMRKALEAIQSGTMSYRETADAYGIPKSTLERHIKKKNQINEEKIYLTKLGSKRSVLSDEAENELERYIKSMDESFYGLSINDIRAIVYQYCEKNNIVHPFNKETKLAGRDFLSGFMKRHRTLSLRKPQSVALNRVYGLNKPAVTKYFDLLTDIIENNNLMPDQIYNCDESGISCVHRPLKVVAQKGKHVVASTTSGERGVTTTVLVAMNAAGSFIPPMIIFKRKRMKEFLLDNTPHGTIGGCSDNGWITTELFEKFVKHFVGYVKCSPTKKALLILDGHKTHTKNLTLIDYARENGLIILSIPPHTSHKLQPLDRSFFKPFKSAFDSACSS